MSKAPTCFEKTAEAILSIRGGTKGASRAAIYKAIGAAYPGTPAGPVRRAINKAIESGLMEYGSSKQRFKLTADGEAALKPKKKKTTPKKNAAPKKKSPKDRKKSPKGKKKAAVK